MTTDYKSRKNHIDITDSICLTIIDITNLRLFNLYFLFVAAEQFAFILIL